MRASAFGKSPTSSPARSIPPWHACMKASRNSSSSGEKTMAERQPLGEALALQAILYLADALPHEDQADFEGRLADDQKAREALTLAVAFVESCAAHEPARPDPAYRRAVLRQATA